MPVIRLFLAVPLTATLTDSLAALQSELSGKVRDVRWTRPENLHLTLRFFGDVAQEDLEKIKVSVLSVKRTQQAFEVVARGLGAFPDPRRPRVLWIGLEPAAPLRNLYRTCQEALLQADITPEPRPFTPHLTLGRLRRRGPDLSTLTEDCSAREFGRLPVAQLVLYQSRLHRSGAEHTPLLTVDLPAADGGDQTRRFE